MHFKNTFDFHLLYDLKKKKKDISLTVYTCSALYFPALLHLLVLARSSRTHTLSVIHSFRL